MNLEPAELRGHRSEPLHAGDQVGARAAVLKPVHAPIEAHVLAAKRLRVDGTTVPILASGKADSGRMLAVRPSLSPDGGPFRG